MSVFLSRMSKHLGIPALLEDALKLKERRRGSSDVEMMSSLIYCLAQGDRSLVDVDRLRADNAYYRNDMVNYCRDKGGIFP